MKHLPPPFSNALILLLAMFCVFSTNLNAQTFSIDSTFTSDAVIHPFGQNDTLYSLKISGSLALNSDTSLVRIIVGNEDSLEYMVYESYPLISEDYNFSFSDQSDETSYLNAFLPSYLKVYIIDAHASIDSLIDNENHQDKLDSLQIVSKYLLDSLKVISINEYIQKKDWDWFAKKTNKSNQLYRDKKGFFGEKYNLLGIDYYSGGVYSNYFLDLLPPMDASNLTSEFDWRKKHDAHLDTSLYWDEDLDFNEYGNGWITGVRDQGSCNSCTAYGAIATLEAFLNLYYNYHFDLIENIRLSERDLFNCTSYPGGGVGC